MILLGWYPILSTVSVDRLQVMASSGSIPSIFRSHSPGHLSKFLGVSVALLVPERLPSIFNCLPQYFFSIHPPLISYLLFLFPSSPPPPMLSPIQKDPYVHPLSVLLFIICLLFKNSIHAYKVF